LEFLYSAVLNTPQKFAP